VEKALQCLVLFAAWTSVHAAESAVAPNAAVSKEVVVIPIGEYRHYVLLPVTATQLKPPRGLLQNVSDRLSGRMLPLLNEWNYSDKVAKVETELAVALVIDASTGVSGTARVMWGPLAGGSGVIAHVDLIERPSGKQAGRQEFFVARKTSLGTDSEYLAYDDLVSQVVAYLRACYSMQRQVDVGIATH
jgi:hypothetical protein